MKGLKSLFLGIFAVFAFSWLGLALVPNAQIGHLDPQSDEEGTDVYPVPPSGMAQRGQKVYTANGCVYCHSQQVRPDYDSSDIERKWGERRSAPRDYIFQRPVVLGKMRMGPDLANVGKRAPADDQKGPAPAPAPAASPGASPAVSPGAAATGSPAPAVSPAVAAAAPAPSASAQPAAAANAPVPAATAPAGPAQATSLDASSKSGGALPPYSAAWHHQHLYAPRSVNLDSNMPAYRFLYEKRRIGGEPSAEALNLTGADAPPAGWEVVPTYDAKCLVAFLMSLDQSHPLQEVKSNAPAAPPPAPGKAASK
jgi:cbb3-type cytochrome oxidase cytochrome c subunit